MPYFSWGQFPRAKQQVAPFYWRSDTLPPDQPIIPYGQGRSYGDVCLNDNGTIIPTHHLNKFISFDIHSGLLRCESGITLAEILQLVIPHGWFLPVTPGTKYVSVGGAIGNDVHGKNHHRVGSFGCHIRQFELARSAPPPSEGDFTTISPPLSASRRRGVGGGIKTYRYICSPTQNVDLFKATIGGLGLTGLITWAEIQLKPISSVYLDIETIKVKNLDEFFELSSKSDSSHEYTVSWVDTTATGKHIGRGLFMRGNHSSRRELRGTLSERERVEGQPVKKPIVSLPFNMPNWFLNIPLIKTFNFVYYNKQIQKVKKKKTHYDPFFYPLDIVQCWNRLYGKRGFQSFQCVVPTEHGKEAMEEILFEIHKSGLASPLTVLKLFGDKQSPGIMSFPRPGVNLLLDFPNVGPKLNTLLQELDTITLSYNGCVNPAKDAHLLPETFQSMYPNWKSFSQYIDPSFSSSFWRRVTRT